MNKNRYGFTLIELLVVISMIGLLASIVMASLNDARKKSRDTRRRADLRQIATALEFYYDVSNAYPSSAGNWRGNCSGRGGYGTEGPTGWIPFLAPTHISVLPLDPRPTEPDRCYIYRSDDGKDYKLLAYWTVESICPVPASDPMKDMVRPGDCSFTIFTPGAASW